MLERVGRIELPYDLRLPVWKTGAQPIGHTRMFWISKVGSNHRLRAPRPAPSH
jgi:hypothetical protein